MTFPAVLSTSSGRRDTTATTHSINLPTGSAVADKLLLVFFSSKNTLVADAYPAGLTVFGETKNTAGSSSSLSAAYRRTNGLESGTISITTSANTRMAYACYFIDLAENPSTQAPQATSGTVFTNSSNPNPPSLSPTGGAKDYLWLSVFSASHGAITSGSSTGLPAGYTNNVGDGSNVGTTTHAGIGSGRRQLNAASEDPGAFTIVSGAGAEESVAMTVAIHPVAGGAASYDDSVSVSRKETVSDQPTVNILSNVTLAQKDGFIDGMGNSIPKTSALNKLLSLTDLAGLGIFKDANLNKSLSLTDSAIVNIFPSLALLQILAATPANFSNMQGSVGLSGDFGINGSPNNNINPNASLLSTLGVSLSGGLSLLSDLTIAERLGFSVLGNVQVYPSLTLGRDLAFVPANIALIGGSASLGQALGLIDVPNLNAQAALSFLQSLGINLTSELTTNQVEALLTLAHDLGITTSAQLNSFPLVGIEKHLFLVDANNANMLGANVLSEIRALNVLGGLALQSSVAIPIDLNILTGKLISVFGDVSVQERLGITDSVIANMQASVSLGEVAGMGNTVNQLLNAGLSINVIGSVLTISGLDVIIIKGFVFTFDSTKDSVSAQDSSNSISTSESDNYS